MCYGPNCGRIFGRIVTVEIWRGALFRFSTNLLKVLESLCVPFFDFSCRVDALECLAL